MALLAQPIESVFSSASRVLVAGAGGGFDVVAGLGVALGLQDAGHEVHLGNLSFMGLDGVEGGEWLDPNLLRVDADCTEPRGYAPEIWLSRWFRTQGQEVPVYCFRKVGARPLTEAYAHLAQHLSIDAVVLVDGGVDALMCGDEFSMGTPTLDHLSVAAASALDVKVKVLATIGFGAERWDKISHAQALERIADLTAMHALLGVESLIAQSAVGRRWRDAVHYIHDLQGAMRQSIICSSIEASLQGRFGDVSVNARTAQTPIWISPLCALCWFFDLGAVAAAKPYMAALRGTETVPEAAELIQAYHDQHQREASTIPI